MINILPNNQCKMINIVWIERGLLLTIIYYIIKKFQEIKNKIIIIDNLRYIEFLKVLFPTLTFSKFIKHKPANYYFNIRSIIKKQDIVIDYLDNYDNFIRTNKISLLPWFDMNDILITYEYDKNKNMNCNKIKKYIKEFSYCKRGNYNNQIWDSYVENYIFKKLGLFYKNIDVNLFINYFNNFVKSNYTNMVIEKPRIYYVEKPNLLIESNNFNYTGSNYTGSNNKQTKLWCEYDKVLVSKISNIFLGKKMLNINEIIDTKINALNQKIIIIKYYSNKLASNDPKINYILKDLNFQLNEIQNIKEGIRNMSELDNLLNKLRYKK